MKAQSHPTHGMSSVAIMALVTQLKLIPKVQKSYRNPFCKRSDHFCSSGYSDRPNFFYSQCPNQNQNSCGLVTNYDKLNIYAEENKKTFTYDRLRWKTLYYKDPAYGVCSYRLMNPPLKKIWNSIPPGGFKGGSLYLTFSKLEPGIQLYVSSNGGIPDFEVLQSSDKKTYKIEGSKYFIITAVPQLNSFNTSFSFEYYTDGDKIEDAPIW